MILNHEITIPVLCPINFTEAKETYFYKEQDLFIGKIENRQHIQFLIPESMYNKPTKLYVKAVHQKGWVSWVYQMATHQLGSNYYYADVTANIHTNVPDKWVGYIELYFGDTLLAKSTLYEASSGGEYYKYIEYTNAKNDWNTVFNSSFLLSIPCGFNPDNSEEKTKFNNYQDQDVQNIKLYAQPYGTVVLTIGAPHGVSNWMYRKLNSVFCCDTIIISGETYKVADGAQLEKVSKTYDGLHILEIELQPLNTYKQ